MLKKKRSPVYANTIKKGSTSTQLGANIHLTSIRNQSNLRCRKMDVQKSIKIFSWPPPLIRGTLCLEPFGRVKVPNGWIWGAILDPKSIEIDAQIDVENILKNHAQLSRNVEKIIHNRWGIINTSKQFWNPRILVWCNASSVKMRWSPNGRSKDARKTKPVWCN